MFSFTGSGTWKGIPGMSTNDSTCLGDSHGSIKNTLASQSKSVVTIYALDHILAYLGANFLLDFHAAHPDIILSVVDTTDDAALDGLAAKKCNFAIVTGPLDNSRFQGDELFFSRYCVRLHKNHPLAAKPELCYADLDGETIISKGRSMFPG